MKVKQAAVVALTESQRSLSLQHLHLVEMIAHSLCLRPADYDEVRSSGHEAIVLAAQKFNPGLGVPFGAFATMIIKWAMHRRLRDLRRLRRHELLLEAGHELSDGWARRAQSEQHLEDELVQMERRFILESALHQSVTLLAREERQVLCDHYFRSRQLKDIAKARGSSYATVRRRHQAAVQRLQKIMLRRLTAQPAYQEA